MAPLWPEIITRDNASSNVVVGGRTQEVSVVGRMNDDAASNISQFFNHSSVDERIRESCVKIFGNDSMISSSSKVTHVELFWLIAWAFDMGR